MQTRAQIMDESAVNRAIIRISHEILERNNGVSSLCILGVKTRGVPFAKRICEYIKTFEGVTVPYGELDITLNRDDIDEKKKIELAKDSIVNFDVENKTVILVDDVLFTGRTAKASLETVFKFGRPNSVQLVVLIDRGHRELPIRPDYVGKNVPTSNEEVVRVTFDSEGNDSAIILY